MTMVDDVDSSLGAVGDMVRVGNGRDVPRHLVVVVPLVPFVLPCVRRCVAILPSSCPVPGLTQDRQRDCFRVGVSGETCGATGQQHTGCRLRRVVVHLVPFMPFFTPSQPQMGHMAVYGPLQTGSAAKGRKIAVISPDYNLVGEVS